MKTSPRFHIGDRVRTTRQVWGLPLGSTGTIHQVILASDLYDVRFDAQPMLRIVHGDALELVRRASTK